MTETMAVFLVVVGMVLLTLFAVERYRLKHPHGKAH
jgi:hypothetical protein